MSDRHFDIDVFKGCQRQSLRVVDAASLLQVNISTVYKLVRSGYLEAHRVGIRGVRIFADSLRDYQERQKIVGSRKAIKNVRTWRRRSNWQSIAQREALAVLQKNGVI